MSQRLNGSRTKRSAAPTTSQAACSRKGAGSQDAGLMDIVCPHCHQRFELTSALAQPLVERVRAEYDARAAEVEARQKELARERRQLDNIIAERVKEARSAIADQEKRRAAAQMDDLLASRDTELETMRVVLAHRDAKLAEAQAVQADFLRRARELDDARRELDLSVERRVNDALEPLRASARAEAEEAQALRLRERDLQINRLNEQIEVLRQKARATSQELQGEAQELELESVLRAHFPDDEIRPVPKGVNGADLLLVVRSRAGAECGAILLEIKQARTWSAAWLAKVREDQRRAKADMALLASQTLSRNAAQAFQFVDGVWVTQPSHIVPVVTALRHALLGIASAREASSGRETKASQLYSYMMSAEFRNRMTGLVEQVVTMQQGLEQERRAMTRIWAARSQQLERALSATAGLFGDVQGLVGTEFKAPPALELEPPREGPKPTGL